MLWFSIGVLLCSIGVLLYAHKLQTSVESQIRSIQDEIKELQRMLLVQGQTHLDAQFDQFEREQQKTRDTVLSRLAEVESNFGNLAENLERILAHKERVEGFGPIVKHLEVAAHSKINGG